MKTLLWTNILDQIGDWNPQLFRELKGRLKLRNVLLVAAIGVIAHILIFLAFQARLPNTELALDQITQGYQYYNEYCTGAQQYTYSSPTCELKANTQHLIINWQRWWQDIFKLYSWLMPYVLLLPSTYFLVSDFSQEERKGTLNFIRLSPQSAPAIFRGKLLGVPILAYLTTAILLPFHLLAGIGASAPLPLLISYYGLVAAASYFLFRLALLFASFAKRGNLGNSNLQGGSTFAFIGVLFSLFFIPVFMSWNIHTVWSNYKDFIDFARYSSSEMNWQWFGLGLSRDAWIGFGFTAINFYLGAFLCSQAVNRHFYNPNLTIISKKQSYVLMLYVQVFMLGFVTRFGIGTEYMRHSLLTLHYVITVMMLLMLIGILSPQRQALIDWVRYSANMRQEPVIQDLLFAEKSPAILAIAVNAAIAGGITFLLSDLDQKAGIFFTFIFGTSMILICALVAQTMLFMKTKQPEAWATGVLMAVIGLPPAMLSALGGTSHINSTLWLFSLFPFVTSSYLSPISIMFGLIGHIAILSTLTGNLKRQLRKAGESELKMLLDKQPVKVLNI